GGSRGRPLAPGPAHGTRRGDHRHARRLPGAWPRRVARGDGHRHALRPQGDRGAGRRGRRRRRPRRSWYGGTHRRDHDRHDRHRGGAGVIHPLHERYARLLVDYCTAVGPGDRVLISLDTAALALGRAVYREVLRAGGEPFLRVSYPEQAADFIELASDALLASAPTLQLDE